jgi:hypothetical protein
MSYDYHCVYMFDLLCFLNLSVLSTPFLWLTDECESMKILLGEIHQLFHICLDQKRNIYSGRMYKAMEGYGCFLFTSFYYILIRSSYPEIIICNKILYKQNMSLNYTTNTNGKSFLAAAWCCLCLCLNEPLCCLSLHSFTFP